MYFNRFGHWLQIKLTVFLLLSTLLLKCHENPPQNSMRPRLVVLFVVDQMRYDYLTRFKSFYAGGLARLLSDGANFPRAYHNHAITETSVGHATISTGCYPSKHGIVSNYWYEKSESKVVYSCVDTSTSIIGNPALPGRSPVRLLCPTIGDWLKSQSPRSKVISISLKDRSAILLGGKNPSNVSLWFDEKTGQMTTSTYYLPYLPTWITAFDSAKQVHRYLEFIWHKLMPESIYISVSNVDTSSWESSGFNSAFPHRVRIDSNQINAAPYKEFLYSPFGDKFLVDFAEYTTITNNLGYDDFPDLLLLSLSSADLIGHRYGPFSQEIEDYYLRLDQYLDHFLNVLDSAIGRDNYLFVLTSDHGVLPIPEQSKQANQSKKRLTYDSLDAMLKTMEHQLQNGGVISQNDITDYERNELFKHGISFSDNLEEQYHVIEKLLAKLRSLDVIADVYPQNELVEPKTSLRPYAALYRNNFCPERSPNIYFRFRENLLVYDSKTGTSHGSPYHYDTHVPLIFFGACIKPGVFKDSVNTVDIAPTIREVLGLNSTAKINGKSLYPFVLERK